MMSLRTLILIVTTCICTLLSCVKPQRFTFGGLSPTQNCLAVLPLIDLQANGHADKKQSDNLVGEYVALALANAGMQTVISPENLESLFAAAGGTTPARLPQELAIKIGRAINAQAVIYGSYFKLALQSTLIMENQPDYLIGIDLYLLDLANNAIVWIFSTRNYSSSQNVLRDLGKLSHEISESLLVNGLNQPHATADSCWNKEKIVLNLRTQILNTPPVSVTPAKAVIEKPLTTRAVFTPATNSSQIALAGKAADYFEKLKVKKPLSLKGLFVGRSTEIAPAQLSVQRDLAKALLALPGETQFVFEAHVDETSDHAADQRLSNDQASKLREKVLGESPTLNGRIEVSAVGGSKPLLPNINQRSREMNRRIVVTAKTPIQ